MEGRGPPSTTTTADDLPDNPSFRVYANYIPTDHHHDNNDNHQFEFHQPVQTGTYVVQVPKDQIYRVPPPENALIAERRRNATPEKQTCFSVKCMSVFLAVVVLMSTFIWAVSIAAAKKHEPAFRVERLHAAAATGKGHRFDVTVVSKNPNDRAAVIFEEGGEATLSFGANDFADGTFPGTFRQEPENSTSVHLSLLAAPGKALPKEVEKSINGTGTKHVELTLGFKVPIKIRLEPFQVKSKTISILCDFKVDKLAKNSRVLSQDCDYSTE